MFASAKAMVLAGIYQQSLRQREFDNGDGLFGDAKCGVLKKAVEKGFYALFS